MSFTRNILKSVRRLIENTEEFLYFLYLREMMNHILKRQIKISLGFVRNTFFDKQMVNEYISGIPNLIRENELSKYTRISCIYFIINCYIFGNLFH